MKLVIDWSHVKLSLLSNQQVHELLELNEACKLFTLDLVEELALEIGGINFQKVHYTDGIMLTVACHTLYCEICMTQWTGCTCEMGRHRRANGLDMHEDDY